MLLRLRLRLRRHGRLDHPPVRATEEFDLAVEIHDGLETYAAAVATCETVARRTVLSVPLPDCFELEPESLCDLRVCVCARRRRDGAVALLLSHQPQEWVQYSIVREAGSELTCFMSEECAKATPPWLSNVWPCGEPHMRLAVHTEWIEEYRRIGLHL